MIGLIFGETNFPIEILKKIKSKKLNYIIIDLTKNKKFKKDKNSFSVSIGQFGKVIKLLKTNNCKKVLFAGKVKKPNLSKLELDFKGIYYISRIIKSSKLGDAAVLREIINILKLEKIKTVSSLSFNPELMLKKGIYSKIKPNREDYINISKAISVLKKINKYNFSQGVVIKKNKIIEIEGNDGTEGMLKKCKNKYQKFRGVLAKFPKAKQDLRIDLPTIGLRTLKYCDLAGINGVVLQSKRNIFLEKEKCINFINKKKMFLLVK